MSSHTEATVRLALIDDHAVSRTQLRNVLDKADNYQVAVSGGTGADVLRKLESSQPHVMVLNGDLEPKRVFSTLQLILDQQPEVRIIVVTAVRKAGFIGRLVSAGASGIVLRDFEDDTLLEAVRRVAENGVYFNRQVCKVIQHLPSPSEEYPEALDLSQRELDILALLCEELTSRQIGERLFISHRTVESHRRRIQKKIGANNLAGLVMYAVRNGIV